MDVTQIVRIKVYVEFKNIRKQLNSFCLTYSRIINLLLIILILINLWLIIVQFYYWKFYLGATEYTFFKWLIFGGILQTDTLIA